MRMKTSVNEVLAAVSDRLGEKLGSNLFSCCVYGSAVRGNAIEGVSDINLLIALENSNVQAHQALAEVMGQYSIIDPFIIERRSLLRTARCFATKFASIQRNYRVLCGADPFAEIVIDPALERLLCEQGLRNLRLRLTYAFVMHGRQRNYAHFLAESVSAIFVQLSDVLWLAGRELPKDFAARIPVMAQTWSVDDAIFRDLLALREKRRSLSACELADWHQRLLAVLDAALRWIEENWRDGAGAPT